MSDWLIAILLGVIEGLTEFIPVSSTGHLLLAGTFLNLPDQPWDTLIVLIQLPAIMAVVVLYFHRLWNVVVRIPTDAAARRFVLAVLIAFLPAAVIGLLLKDFIKEVLFDSPRTICWSLIIGGVVLAILERISPKPKYHDAAELNYATALGIGLFQVLAMVPGVSRSGATIVGGLMLGLDKKTAAEFSFFLAIPTMCGAFAKDAWDNKDNIRVHDIGLIAVGSVVSFVVALIVIRWMLGFVEKRGFTPFAWWRIIVGVGGLVLLQYFARTST
jgi:undecaprenyl-diphosphatase